MKLEEFDYHLPPDLIAQYPTLRRADSRMLVVDRAGGTFTDRYFRELPEILQPRDVLVVNDSRVLPARLMGHRIGLTSQAIRNGNPARDTYLRSPIEVLLARQLDSRTWEALVRPGRKVRVGERLIFGGAPVKGEAAEKFADSPGDGSGAEVDVEPHGEDHRVVTELIEAQVIARGDFGLRTLRFCEGVDVAQMIEKIGHIPLPPYIDRPAQEQDRERYQTVYARHTGSVAAPTAGLHFTEAMLSDLQLRGIERAEITLHVGLGTFQPIRTDEIIQHHMHPEPFEITPQAAVCLNQALAESRRVIAVGTTTVRTLEHVAAQHGGRIEAARGETQLFIIPGFKFQVIGGLLTNFHLPRTTLLMLVAAFAGRELILAAYEHAVRERYRFYSYGDCMLIL